MFQSIRFHSSEKEKRPYKATIFLSLFRSDSLLGDELIIEMKKETKMQYQLIYYLNSFQRNIISKKLVHLIKK